MYKGKTIGVITARGGSKGIPKKNIKLLNKKPLIAYTIESALSSNLDAVYVSTDSEEIADISTQYGATVIKRPTSISGDNSTSVDAVVHALELLKSTHIEPDTLMLLQPTSPLRNSQHINQALESFYKKNLPTTRSLA